MKVIQSLEVAHNEILNSVKEGLLSIDIYDKISGKILEAMMLYVSNFEYNSENEKNKEQYIIFETSIKKSFTILKHLEEERR